jgi:hypothetical protein
MAAEPSQQSYFDKARIWAATVLVVAGVAAVAGSLLDWVTIEALGAPSRAAHFGHQRIQGPARATPFTGIEAKDGWWTLAAGVVVVVAAGLLIARRRALYAWLAFLASIVLGAVAVADFRGIENLSARMHVAADVRPAFGITLVAASSLAGLIASLAGVAASPRLEL